MPISNNDIILATTPPWGVNNPPVGLAYLASYLKSRGYGVDVFDFNIDFYNHSAQAYRNLWHVENKNYWSNERTFPLLRKVYDSQINRCIERMVLSGIKIIGFSVVDPKERMTIEMINRIKGQDRDNSVRVVLGGPACSTSEQRKIFLDHAAHFIDGFVIGEGEETLCAVVDALKNKRRISGIPGVLAVEKSKCLEAEFVPRPAIKDLDGIPFPSYEEFNPDSYASRNSLILEWSRGCIGNCAFCKGRAISGSYRFKSPSHIMEELRFHLRSGVADFTICDNLVNGNPAQLEEVCDSIIKEGLRLRWNCQAMPLPAMSVSLLKKMAKAGCSRVQWGLESGSDKVLKLMNKRHFKVAEAERVIRESHEAGISTEIFIIIGFPGEEESDFMQTVDFVRRNKKYIDVIKSINTLHIIFGTDICSFPDKYGVILPEVDLHYKWRTSEGKNTAEIRNDRAQRLVKLVLDLGVPFLETNYMEGKERADGNGPDSHGELSMEEFLRNINDIKTLNAGREIAAKDNPAVDIALVICPPFGVDMPPLGMAYLAGYLKAKRYLPKVFDLNVKIYNSLSKELKELWHLENVRSWCESDVFPQVLKSLEGKVCFSVDKILSSGSPVIGFSVNQSNMVFTLEVTRRIKALDKNKVIIFGGPGCFWRNNTALPVGVYNHTTRECMIYPGLVDAFVIGEGEESLFQIMESLKNNKPLPGIPGVVAFDGEGYKELVPRPFIPELDKIPYPYFGDYNLDEYSEHKLPFIMGRGCTGQCAFCNDRPMAGPCRVRSAENVFNEIKSHIENSGIRYFHSVDLLINANLKQLRDFCDMVINAKYDIRWTGQAVVRTDMGYDFFLRMKQAGCDSLVYGCESFSDKVLKKMGKYFTVSEAASVLELTHKAGITALTNIIVGFPGEGEEEFRETCRFLKDNRQVIDKISSVQTLHLTTGSDIEVSPEKYGIILPEVEPWFRWRTNDGNTYEVRKKRLKTLVELISSQEKSINKINLYEDNISRQRAKFENQPNPGPEGVSREVSEKIEELKNQVRSKEKIIREKERALEEIAKSRAWKLACMLRRVKHILLERR